MIKRYEEKLKTDLATEEQKARIEKLKADNIYSFEHDDEYIYSAFLDQYGIDLKDIKHLHWWKFKSPFKGLKEDNLICKIMRYRIYNYN
ncbi:Gp15 family bacteriophage protein [Senegalia massiliensis]|uniref:Gp15 family bacteriophage protein n=1 Tax=Senegalia massiliensis TaxID=1720316 RepID=UPI0013EF5316